MTRKDYELIAAALKDCSLLITLTNDEDTKKIQASFFFTVTERLANQLKRENPRFDSVKFLRAAGILA